jgi:DNA helicase-2/ATP-dependent DNA helicase PcrA
MDLTHLNEPQRQAVEHGNAPLLVLAGAGTGKTSVITHRIAHLIRVRKVLPAQLLAVTFTNKAAREMRERTAKLAQLGAEALDMGTFHRICGRLLRRYGSALGLDPAFVIYDGDDQLQLIRRLLGELNLDAQEFHPRTLRGRLENWKNQGLLPDQVKLIPRDPIDRKSLDVYRLYRKRCLEANAVDFGDMLLHCVTLLQTQPAILRTLQQRWTHLLVDEYQDTNAVQYLLLKLLVTSQHSLTVVGDDDQSIYRWRGADIGNILRFERDYPGATVIRLEQNYRCTQTILNAANKVIANNTARKGKTLFAQQNPGKPIVLRVYDTERDEAQAAAAAISEALTDGLQPSDAALLYRTNAQSRPLEDALRRRRIPYKIYGGVRFYDRREVKDALAYLRLLVNPRSTLDFLRVINLPARGIGKTSVETLTDVAAQEGISLLEAAVKAADTLRGKARTSVLGFLKMVEAWKTELHSGEALGRVTEHVLRDSGYWGMLSQDESSEAAERLENLKELVAAVDEYEAEQETPTLPGFLEDVALASDTDTLGVVGGQVAMMTLHSAKGLEFSMVLLPGMEEGLFPHSRSLTEPAALEEERRLCYVGLTRAKHTLYLSAARTRTVFGVPQVSSLSRFLGEIPQELLDMGPSGNLLHSPGDDHLHRDAAVDVDAHLTDPQPSYHDSQEAPTPISAKTMPTIRKENDTQGFAPGTRVLHALFGEGKVLGAEIAGSRQMLTIQFPLPVGRKVVVARFIERLSAS